MELIFAAVVFGSLFSAIAQSVFTKKPEKKPKYTVKVYEE